MPTETLAADFVSYSDIILWQITISLQIMDEYFSTLLVIIPFSATLGGFLFARLFGMFSGDTFTAQMFDWRKWGVSLGIGLFFGLLFTGLALLTMPISSELLIYFMSIFGLGAAGVFLGASLGSLGTKNQKTQYPGIHTDQIQITDLPGNIQVEISLNSIKISIRTRKKWGWFLLRFFEWLLMALIFLPIAGFAMFGILGEFLSDLWTTLGCIPVAVLILYLLYVKFIEALDDIFDHELIIIDPQTVYIERSGSGFRVKKIYPAENVARITTLVPPGITSIPFLGSSFFTSNMPSLSLWHEHGLKRFRTFGRGIDSTSTMHILNMIYSKYPQYRG